VSNDEDEQAPKNLKERLAAASSTNPKTIERNTKALLLTLFGVTEKDLDDPALRAYLRFLIFGESPEPWVILEKPDADKTQE